MAGKDTTTKKVRTTGCRACNHTLAYPTKDFDVFICAKCGAVYGTTYLGESYTFVLPWMASAEQCDRAEANGTVRYFDFTTLGSKGIDRRHGWYDTVTRLITQVG